MAAFTIKEIENLSGIKAHTIRIWEQRYSFLCPKRTDANIRYYSNEELKKVLNVSLLNKHGYKISHINRMSAKEMQEKILSLSQPQAQQERICNELIRHMVDLDINAFEATLNNYIHVRGLEKTIINIIFSFLQRVGILWAADHKTAHEHLISNIIRQKLIAGIESTASHLQVNKTVLLFLPEGEHNELALLLMHYLLKSRGAKVLYLGANVPIKDLEYLVKNKKPDILYTHLTSVTNNFSVEKFMSKINPRIYNTSFIISGKQIQHHKKRCPPNIFLKRSMPEVLEFVSKINM